MLIPCSLGYVQIYTSLPAFDTNNIFWVAASCIEFISTESKTQIARS